MGFFATYIPTFLCYSTGIIYRLLLCVLNVLNSDVTVITVILHMCTPTRRALSKLHDILYQNFSHSPTRFAEQRWGISPRPLAVHAI
jgi:hypothetical protein